RSGSLDAQFESQRVENADNCGELRVALGTKGLVEASAGQAGLARQLGDISGARDYADGVGDIGRVSRCESIAQKVDLIFLGIEILGRIKWRGFGSHWCSPSIERRCQRIRRRDIAVLCRFVPAAQQHDQIRPAQNVIEVVSGTEMNASFHYSCADGSCIAEKAGLQSERCALRWPLGPSGRAVIASNARIRRSGE